MTWIKRVILHKAQVRLNDDVQAPRADEAANRMSESIFAWMRNRVLTMREGKKDLWMP